MELSLSPGVASSAAIQELSRMLWNPIVLYRVHQSSPLVPVRNQIDSLHNTLPDLSNIHLNVIHSPSTSEYIFQVFSSFWHLNPSHLHSCYISYPYHPPRLDNSNYTWRRVQVMKLLVMQFSPNSRHSIPLWSK
jgi:hypothetical protein